MTSIGTTHLGMDHGWVLSPLGLPHCAECDMTRASSFVCHPIQKFSPETGSLFYPVLTIVSLIIWAESCPPIMTWTAYGVLIRKSPHKVYPELASLGLANCISKMPDIDPWISNFREPINLVKTENWQSMNLMHHCKSGSAEGLVSLSKLIKRYQEMPW